MPERPTGTVTFLFTDIEGSTRLWQDHPEAMRNALGSHDRILRATLDEHGGYIFSTAGDAYAAAFTRAGDALTAARDAQVRLGGEQWGETPIRVRMGLHTGEAHERDGDYFGPALNRGARVMAVGHGGQVLVSEACARVVADHLPDDCELLDLGRHRLKDLSTPEHIFRLRHPDLVDDFPPLRTLDAVPNNLPAEVASFIGRRTEIGGVGELLSHSRLVTVTGVGGVGKTRTSIEVAAGVTDEFPDGVWFVDLSPITTADLIGKQVAIAIGVQEQLDRAMVTTLHENLADRSTLIVLDNCEHVIDGAAVFVDGLLRACPEVRVLATSREALGVMGEATWPLDPLSVPLEGDDLDIDIGGAPDAMRLLVERAQQVDPTFSLTRDNAVACAEICRRLDGVPLAIELAAARINVLTLRQIADRLDDRLGLLTKGSRTAAPRQQTLRAAIDWSYDLLEPAEQRLLRTVAVFRGGFSLEALEAVWAELDGDGDVLELLTQLVDKSLVVASIGEATRRFRLLETIREYADDALGDAGEREAAHEAHRSWFTAWGGRQGRRVTRAEQLVALDALEADHENLRAVLERSLETDDVGPALELAADISHFWWLHSHFGESGEWFNRLILVADRAAPRVQAKLLMGAGEFSMSVSDHVEADRRMRAAGDIARSLDDPRLEAWTEAYMTTNEVWRIDFDAARDHAARASELFQQVGDFAGLAYVMFLQVGIDYGVLWGAGEVTTEAADGFIQRIEPIHAGVVQLGDRNQIGHVLDLLGPIELDAGRIDDAAEHLAGAVEALDTLGNQICLAHALDHVGLLATVVGDHTAAATLLAATAALRDHLGVKARLAEQAIYDHALEEARAALDPDHFDEAWERGSAMQRRDAVAHGRSIVEDAVG